MKDFDRIIDDQFGIIFGSRNLVFLKTDKGEDIYGPENKYLEICLSLAKHNGCTYVVSANQDEADLASEIERIDNEVEDYDQIYYIGISDGGLVGAKQCWMVDAIRDAYLLNVPLSLEDNFKDTLSGIQKFQGNFMEFEFGDQDPSCASVGKIEEINKSSIKCNKYGGMGHVFDIDALEFAIYVFLNKQMYSRKKYNVSSENVFALGTIVSAFDDARNQVYRKDMRIIYLYGEKGCGKTHLLNMLFDYNRGGGIRIELDDAEEVHDYDEFILGYPLNDIAMIDDVDCLDSEGVSILKEVINCSYLDKKEDNHGPIIILTSTKSPEETFADKDLISIIRQGVVEEINKRGSNSVSYYIEHIDYIDNLEDDLEDGVFDLNYLTINKEETGLPYDVIMASSGVAKSSNIHPYLQISYGRNLIAITIEDDPKIHFEYETGCFFFNWVWDNHLDLDDVFSWISKHCQVLLRHWNQEITDREVLNELVDC